MCSNETVNIWTHLIGAVWFMYLTIYDNQILLPSVRAKFEDHIVMTSFEICFEVSNDIFFLFIMNRQLHHD